MTDTSNRTVIAVGAAPSRFKAQGTFVDGERPLVERVDLRLDDDAQALIIRRPNATPMTWSYEELRALRDQAGDGRVLLGLADGSPARVEVADVDAGLIRTRAKRLNRRIVTVRRRRLITLTLAAFASVALMIFVLIPTLADRLAPLLPPEGEVALGEATLGHIQTALDETGLGIGVPLCEAPEGRAALDTLTARLETVAPALETPLTVRVLDHPMVNAFALPGGNVVLFRGLLEAAESADEIAAVMAHEIGHVAARDPTRIAMRSAGSIGVLGLLFGDFAGGTIVLFLAERIIQADYTQEAEAAADAYGSALLIEAGIDPTSLATLFERLAQEEGELPEIVEHFMAHPALEDRIDAARTADFDQGAVTPALPEAEWQALQAICTNPT